MTSKTGIWVLCFLLACGVFVACGDDEGDSSSDGQDFSDLTGYSQGTTLREADLEADHILGVHHHVLLHLESNESDENDTGEPGVDRLRYVWPADSSHTFCVDDEEELGHSVRLVDANGNELGSATGHENCFTAAITAGAYHLEIHNGSKGEDGKDDMVFVHPAVKTDEPVMQSVDEKRSSKLTDAASCEILDGHTKECDCTVGSYESWATDYVGAPGYGEVVLVSLDEQAYVTNLTDASHQFNQSGPSHRAIKCNGPCVTLANTIIQLDDSLSLLYPGASTGVWIYRDTYYGGSNSYYYQYHDFRGDPYIPDKSISSLYVMTFSQDNTKNLISSKSCQQCDLHGAKLQYEDLTGARLQGANLTGARLDNADLTNADLTNANLTNAQLPDAVLAGATLVGVHGNGANFTNTDLSNANLSNAFFNSIPEQHINGAVFTDAYMPDANLSNSNFTQAVMSNINLYTATTGATAQSANFSGAQLDNAVLYNTDFNSATLDGTKFDNAVLINATMRGATQHPDGTYGYATFNQALLAGTDFTNTTLALSDLSNAQISRSEHSVDVVVKASRTTTETRTYTCNVTVKPTVTSGSTCPDRHSAPCTCDDYPAGSGCTLEGRWTPPDPPTYIGQNDPGSW